MDEVMRENPGEQETGKKRESRGGKPAKVSRTDPDARTATSANKLRLEPSYKQHTAVAMREGLCSMLR